MDYRHLDVGDTFSLYKREYFCCNIKRIYGACQIFLIKDKKIIFLFNGDELIMKPVLLIEKKYM